MKRTQIYLDEDQKKALRALALERDSSVSDIIRQAIDRLLHDEVHVANWAERMGTLQERVRSSVMERLGYEPSDEDIDAAARRARVVVAKRRHAST